MLFCFKHCRDSEYFSFDHLSDLIVVVNSQIALLIFLEYFIHKSVAIQKMKKSWESALKFCQL